MSLVASPLPVEIEQPGGEGKNRTALLGLAWAGVLIGVGPGKILCNQFGWHPGLWLPLAETVFLLCLAVFTARQRTFGAVTGFLVAIATTHFAWEVAVPWIEASNVAQSVSGRLSWGGQFFLSRAIRTIGAFLMLLTLIGSNIGTRELFLCKGDWSAQVQPEPLLPLKGRVSWLRLTMVALPVTGVLFPIFLFCTLHPQPGRIHLFVSALPWGLATAILNAANEEFQFRSILLARLRHVIPSSRAILLVGAFFGIGHYFGQPGGWAGVILAGAAGCLWAKSMIETRGFTCAFLSHFAQDLVIFALLAMSNVSFPKAIG
jgi:membrane protease YdiL (CAAX protease family)